MKIFVPAFIAGLILTGCGGAASTPLTPAQTTRANARAAVTVAASGFVMAANACLAATEAAQDPSIAAKCAALLDPAHDLIVEAAQAVDANWSAQVACDLGQAVALTTTALSTLGLNTAAIAPVLADAATLAVALSGVNCAYTDAGGQ